MTIDFLRIELEPDYFHRTNHLTLRVCAQVNGTPLSTFVSVDENHFEPALDEMLHVAGQCLKRLAKAEAEKRKGPRTRAEVEAAIEAGLGKRREDLDNGRGPL